MLQAEQIIVKEYPYGLTKVELETANDIAQVMAEKMYDRQKEFSVYNKEKAVAERVNKIKTGIISEMLVKTILNSSKVTEIVYGGFSTQKSINGDSTMVGVHDQQRTDEFDFVLGGKTFDIKSSVEKNPEILYLKNDRTISEILLSKRNFTLPVDQKIKDYILQLIYVSDKVYFCGGISTKILAVPENIRTLKLNNGNIQKTYMKQLSYGQPIHEILKYCKAEKTSNNYTDLLFGRKQR
jgi:hypothetical protein